MKTGFNLEEFKAGKKALTRDCEEISFSYLCDSNIYPIIGSNNYSYTEAGRYDTDCEGSNDLVSMVEDTEQELPMTTPEHYSQGGIEPIKFINSHNLSFCTGNVVKYVCRAAHKGTQEEDLKKAIDYLHFELERISNLKQ